MKKLLKALILCMLVLSISISAFACGSEEAEVLEPTKKRTFEGTHIYNQTDTGKYLVKDGKTEYSLVVNSNTNITYAEAKTDFALLFQKATGITINIVNDVDVTYSPTAKYISLGDTTLVEQAGIDPNEWSFEKLGDEGVRILTVGDSIFLLGAELFGVNYAVYTFMEMAFNFECYYRNCIYIDTGVYNYPLMTYDVTDLPDVKFGDIADYQDKKTGNANKVTAIDSLVFGANAQTEVTLRSNRTRSTNVSYSSLVIPAYANPNSEQGLNIHNILEAYLHPLSSVHSPFGVEPAWVSDSGTQACFTAHGDAESLDRFVEHCTKIICNSITRVLPSTDPEKKNITITCSDGSTSTCMCEACTEIANANNGAFVASHILFVNRVATNVRNWLEENKDQPFYRDDFTVYIFAYGETTSAPAYYDEKTGKSTPCSGDMELVEGAGIFYCGPMSVLYPVYHERNTEARIEIDGWYELTENKSGKLMVWQNGLPGYGMFSDRLQAANNDYYEYFASYDVEELYMSTQEGEVESSAFGNLQWYVQKKLKWDTTLNMNELIDDFMLHMYGREAGEVLKNLYEMLKNHDSIFRAHTEMVDGVANYYYGYKKEYWPYQLLATWYNMVEEAVKCNDYLKDEDPDLYAVLTHRIRLEAISPLYEIIDLYSMSSPREFSEEQLAEYKTALADITQHHKNMKFRNCSQTVYQKAIS